MKITPNSGYRTGILTSALCLACFLGIAPSPAAELWIYTDSLASGFANWGWGLNNQNWSCATPVYAGSYSAAAGIDSGSWGGYSFYHATSLQNPASYGAVEFYIRASASGVQLQVGFEGGSGSSDYVSINNSEYLADGTVDTATWKKVNIPVADFGNIPANCTRLDILDSSGSGAPIFYIDNLRLCDLSQVPPTIRGAHPISRTNVLVYFSQPLAEGSLPGAQYLLSNPSATGYSTNVPGTYSQYVANRQAIVLVWPFAFPSVGTYTLDLSGIEGTNGLSIADHSTATFRLANETLVVNVDSNRHAISPYIYGMSTGPGGEDYVKGAGLTLVRWGGNRSSVYNWKIDADSAGNDWYFLNGGGGNTNATYNWAVANASAGAASFLSIPSLDWVARDRTSYSYSVAKYGAQELVSPYNSDQGNGKTSAGVPITSNDPRDAFVPSRPAPGPGDPTGTVYQCDWLTDLRTRLGNAAVDVIPFLCLDNELEIANSTHQDVHPAALTYDEMWARFSTNAMMIKSTWPTATVVGPANCGWWYYWNSEAGASDKTAHGGVDLIPWLLTQFKNRDQAIGRRTLDVLDIHYYPYDNSEASPSLDSQARRFRCVRSFWDPTYRDETWIGSDDWATATQPNRNYVQLIPRFKALIASLYPGTKLGITEWRITDVTAHISTALATADVLGVFAREDLYLASLWGAPATNEPTYQAFKLYGNYDGNGSRFESVSVDARSTDESQLSVYAAVSPAGDVLTLMCINKNPTNDIAATVNIAGFLPNPTADVHRLYSFIPGSIVSQQPEIRDCAASFETIFPAYSAGLVVLRRPSPDSDADGMPDSWENLYTNPTAASATPLDPGSNDALADNDQDGMTNIDECRERTDPTDPADACRIRMAVARGTNLFFTAATRPDRRYLLEASTNLLNPAGWTSSVPSCTGTGAMHLWGRPMDGSNAFFRLRSAD